MDANQEDAAGKVAELVGEVGPIEIRWSDGSNVWPGYAPNMTMETGYWAGTHQEHSHVGVERDEVERSFDEIIKWL
jgi:hypothetical protein